MRKKTRERCLNGFNNVRPLLGVALEDPVDHLLDVALDLGTICDKINDLYPYFIEMK